jgi:hypothetical protein
MTPPARAASIGSRHQGMKAHYQDTRAHDIRIPGRATSDTPGARSGYVHHWQWNSDFVASFFSNHE